MKQKLTFPRSLKKGFTLLELLVVISIIGILIAMGSVAFSTAQKRARDAKRRADIKAISNAFEQFYADNNSVYDATCANMWGATYFPGGAPTAPKTGDLYSFSPHGCSSTTTTYCVCAKLDDTTSGNASANDCTTGTGFYCLQQLQ